MLREGLQVHTAAPETLPSRRVVGCPRTAGPSRWVPALCAHSSPSGQRPSAPRCRSVPVHPLGLGPGRSGGRGQRAQSTAPELGASEPGSRRAGGRRGSGCCCAGGAAPGAASVREGPAEAGARGRQAAGGEGGLGGERPGPRRGHPDCCTRGPGRPERRCGNAGSPATAGRPEPLHTARRGAGVTCPPSPNGRDCGRSAARQVRLQPATRPADDAPRLWRAGSQEGPAPAQSAAKPSAATSSASSEKFQGEWFVVGLAGSTHRKMDRFLLNPFTAVFEQNKNSRLEVSYAMIRGRRCVSWSYVLIPAAKPGAFSVDSREEPEEVQVYDTDYSVFALMLFRRQSGGQSVLRVTLLCRVWVIQTAVLDKFVCLLQALGLSDDNVVFPDLTGNGPSGSRRGLHPARVAHGPREPYGSPWGSVACVQGLPAGS
ncbi:epididymal-specific lipocalin-12 [Mustela nigripes]|nr:epididymal-specific lipocalin-12 [Mustela nigripes]